MAVSIRSRLTFAQSCRPCSTITSCFRSKRTSFPTSSAAVTWKPKRNTKSNLAALKSRMTSKSSLLKIPVTLSLWVRKTVLLRCQFRRSHRSERGVAIWRLLKGTAPWSKATTNTVSSGDSTWRQSTNTTSSKHPETKSIWWPSSASATKFAPRNGPSTKCIKRKSWPRSPNSSSWELWLGTGSVPYICTTCVNSWSKPCRT